MRGSAATRLRRVRRAFASTGARIAAGAGVLGIVAAVTLGAVAGSATEHGGPKEPVSVEVTPTPTVAWIVQATEGSGMGVSALQQCEVTGAAGSGGAVAVGPAGAPTATGLAPCPSDATTVHPTPAPTR